MFASSSKSSLRSGPVGRTYTPAFSLSKLQLIIYRQPHDRYDDLERQEKCMEFIQLVIMLSTNMQESQDNNIHFVKT
jgi:hypothetical protein